MLVKCGDLACVFADLVMGFWFRGMNWLHIGKKGCFDVCLCPFFLGVFSAIIILLLLMVSVGFAFSHLYSAC